MTEEENNNNEINQLCQHAFQVCSQLPFLSPIFSCAPCDEWRNRVHSAQYKKRPSLDRHSLSSRYQCQQIRKGYLPIHVRVILKSPIASSSSPDLSETANCQLCTTTTVACLDKKKEKRAQAI
jgi:hypothetical protein